MGGKCQICSYDRCSSALELHHIDSSQKEFGFGGIRANPKAIAEIKEELKKCILLCANCHREVHSGIVCVPTKFISFDESVFDSLIPEKKVKAQKEKKDRKKILLTNEEIFVILQEQYQGNKSRMAKDYGVSETAIRKRLQNTPRAPDGTAARLHRAIDGVRFSDEAP